MSIVMLKEVTLSYGERDLFDNISIDFQEDQKVGIIGRNGAGKSTLLKVISGQQAIDSGKVTLNKQMRIAYLPQEVVLNSNKFIFDELFSVFESYTDLEKEQKEIETQLEGNPENGEELVERYQQVLDILCHFDRLDAEKRAIEVLLGLGFEKEKFHDSVNTLSVGWKMRLVLAKLLLQQADFYLFDEPTNHLDIVTKEWFLQFLRQSSFGYLLVTHDRYFLDNACDWIFALSRGNGEMYYGNYSTYLAQYEREQAEQKSAHFQQQKDIARRKETINKFRASASRAKMAQSMIKQLEKIELIEIDPPEPTVSFSFSQLERSGNVVLQAKDLSYRYDINPIFQHASCEIIRNHKVALVAANGMGKSTLFDLLVGKLPLQTGSVEFGHNVQYALFEQDQTKALDHSKTVLQEVEKGCENIPTAKIRAFLGAFLFTGDDVYKKIDMLSGGEKNRVAMVKVLLKNANFLLLGEPTNHLDLFAKSVLLQALQQYPGTLLFVSHDHQFIQELATDILELTPEGLYYYPGTYEEFLAGKKAREKMAEAQQMQKAAQKAAEPKETKIDPRTLEQLIIKLEKRIGQKADDLGNETYGTDAYAATLKELTKLQEELQKAMAEWEALV